MHRAWASLSMGEIQKTPALRPPSLDSSAAQGRAIFTPGEKYLVSLYVAPIVSIPPMSAPAPSLLPRSAPPSTRA